ncbi:hypothetical protein KDH83_12945 [Achromobacter sp. Marseille-Q0513]|uniref:hypothetical protein n=1 Tax=Achromobacter sp. Marseille-Q0513 TaxID=2829161 RepID=UPI001B8FEA82|nr:hypothetical protein [Achromobacter sp. Marseille-Q0513]MBR8654201.1 hypothetical protein [Achromobacter sp. Marseille-Q0513]
MKVKNTSSRVIKLLNGKDKVTLVPGSDEAHEVTECAEVQFYLDAGDLTETAARRGRPPGKADGEQRAQGGEASEA